MEAPVGGIWVYLGFALEAVIMFLIGLRLKGSELRAACRPLLVIAVFLLAVAQRLYAFHILVTQPRKQESRERPHAHANVYITVYAIECKCTFQLNQISYGTLNKACGRMETYANVQHPAYSTRHIV